MTQIVESVKEKRESPRVQQELPVELIYKDENNTVKGKTSDLSCIGAKLILNHSLEQQTQYAISLELPHGKEHFHGVVVRCVRLNENKYEVSLYFSDITLGTKQKINNFVKEKWV